MRRPGDCATMGRSSPPPCALIRLALGFTVPSLRNRYWAPFLSCDREINYRAKSAAPRNLAACALVHRCRTMK